MEVMILAHPGQFREASGTQCVVLFRTYTAADEFCPIVRQTDQFLFRKGCDIHFLETGQIEGKLDETSSDQISFSPVSG